MGGKILEYEAKTILKEGHRQGRKQGHEEGRKEGRKQGREEGREEGIIALVETLKEIGQTSEFIMKKIMQKFSLTEQDAMKYLKN